MDVPCLGLVESVFARTDELESSLHMGAITEGNGTAGRNTQQRVLRSNTASEVGMGLKKYLTFVVSHYQHLGSSTDE